MGWPLRPGRVIRRVAHVIEEDDPNGDWTRPGVFRCAEDVYRIPLPLPQDGLRAVNVYAVRHGERLTLIDAGWSIPEARDLLGKALAELDAGFGDVERFLVTHVHRDHYTQAVVLRREFGTRVALGRGEQPGLDIVNDPARPAATLQRARLDRSGAQELLARLEELGPPSGNENEWENPDDWIEDGAALAVGDRTLTAVATPGHTRGHVVFADDAAGLLFAGDHVLPRITPSIALEPLPPANPLADYLTSLQLMHARPDAALLPAHGPIGMRVHERVDELLAHHATRLDDTLAAVAAGRGTAYGVAQALTWTRREKSFADLDPFNAMLATLETLSHLDVLAARGLVARSEDAGTAYYVPS